MYAADTRMGDLSREPNFLMEECQPICAMRDLLRQELQSDGLAELQVVSSIDFAHPAAAQQTDDAVAAGQDRARNELRAVERVRRGQLIGCGHGQRRRVRQVSAGAAFRAVAARIRNVAPAGRTAHRTA